MYNLLINEYPELLNVIKRRNKQFVFLTETKNGAPHGKYWYRFFQPDDPEIGGTEHQYYATLTSGSEEHLLAQASDITVPTANAYVSYGWYCDVDLGATGYLLVKKQTVTKDELPGRIPYEAKNPQHLYLDFDHVVFSEEQDEVDYVIYNNFGDDQIGIVIPFMFRIASKSALNLE